ncbi:MAG: PLP-dependent aminotransferase family protein [Deltaproteobacteria bacterium]|nr:PLP-dependent aminotransferase family protein [Deltaproteobacteria bacterium]
MGHSATKYEQVESRIAGLIDCGTLRGGQRIPSVRAMAVQMRVSVMTVLQGYRRLEDRGLIESRPKSGYFVRPELMRRVSQPALPPPPQVDPIRLSSPSVRIPDLAAALLLQKERPNLLPLGAGVPSAQLLPGEALSVRLARAVRSCPDEASRYAPGIGLQRLREQLALRMLDSGCSLGPDELLVTVGATEALSVALQAVAEPGDVVAVESPGYLGFYAALARLHLRTVEVQSDPTTGLSLPVLERLLSRHDRVRALVLCSTNSNPTGSTMPERDKQALVEICRRAGVIIVEDDTFGDVTFTDRRACSLKSLDPENVVYIGSLSKVLSPGCRIGWVAGGRHHGKLVDCHLATVLAAPTSTQMAVASFLADGAMVHHLRRLGRHCNDSAALMRRAIAGALPKGTKVTNPGGGLFLWVELPEGCDSCSLMRAAVTRGFSVASGRLFSSGKHYGRFLRLNTAIVWSETVEKAFRALGSLVRDQLKGSSASGG